MATTDGGQVSVRFCHPLDHQMEKSPVNAVVAMAPLLGADRYTCLP